MSSNFWGNVALGWISQSCIGKESGVSYILFLEPTFIFTFEPVSNCLTSGVLYCKYMLLPSLKCNVVFFSTTTDLNEQISSDSYAPGAVGFKCI